MKKTTIVEIIVALFILILIYFSIAELMAVKPFTSALRRSPLISNTMAKVLAWTLPGLQLAIATFLFIRRTRLLGQRLLLILMILYTFYTSYVLLFATPMIPGLLQGISWMQQLVLNLILIILAYTGILLARDRLREEETHSVIFT